MIIINRNLQNSKFICLLKFNGTKIILFIKHIDYKTFFLDINKNFSDLLNLQKLSFAIVKFKYELEE